jgi:hypothetical protein
MRFDQLSWRDIAFPLTIQSGGIMSDKGCSRQQSCADVLFVLMNTDSALNLYRSIDVWERKDETTLVRYRCFESLSNNTYSVQSADFYRNGTATNVLDSQFIELLLEQDPVERTGGYPTLVEAVAAHKREFGT